MTFFHQKFFTQTKGQFDFIDITDLAKSIVEKSGVKNGFLNVESLHTTFAIIINENESRLITDIKAMLKRLVPQDIQYHHPDNGYAHCRSALLGPSETLNVYQGKIELGNWQRIFAVELDSSRPREISFAVIGE